MPNLMTAALQTRITRQGKQNTCSKQSIKSNLLSFLKGCSEFTSCSYSTYFLLQPTLRNYFVKQSPSSSQIGNFPSERSRYKKKKGQMRQIRYTCMKKLECYQK